MFFPLRIICVWNMKNIKKISQHQQNEEQMPKNIKVLLFTCIEKYKKIRNRYYTKFRADKNPPAKQRKVFYIEIFNFFSTLFTLLHKDMLHYKFSMCNRTDDCTTICKDIRYQMIKQGRLNEIDALNFDEANHKR